MSINTPTGKFFFDPEDPVYQQHFPDCPVVPGSLIIKAFFKAVFQHGYDCRESVLKDFRFKEFLKPGSYDYYLRSSGNRIYCSLRSANQEYVSGVITNAL